MRVPDTSSDRYLFFVAVDDTDLVTRETGFGGSGWTVYRCRNDGSAIAYTTPTVQELDDTNMPGVYRLLLDEGNDLDTGHDEEEVVVHITHAGMAPVTRTYELFRVKATEGQTITVASGRADADAVAISGDTVAADRFETMLDGTGGETLSLGQLRCISPVGSGVAAILAAGDDTGPGMQLEGGGGSPGAPGLYIQGNGSAGTTSPGLIVAGGPNGHGAVFDGGAAAVDVYLNNAALSLADMAADIDVPVSIPGQVAPPAAPTLLQAIGWLYKAFRNKKTQTATLWSLFADNESTVDAKATVGDDGTIATKGEIESGP